MKNISISYTLTHSYTHTTHPFTLTYMCTQSITHTFLLPSYAALRSCCCHTGQIHFRCLDTLGNERLLTVDIVHCAKESAADDSGLQGWMYFGLLWYSPPWDTQVHVPLQLITLPFSTCSHPWPPFLGSRIHCWWSVQHPAHPATIQHGLVPSGASCTWHRGDEGQHK